MTTTPTPGALTRAEIESQPGLWQEVLRHAGGPALAAPGERVLFIGCGTSAFVAHSLAVLRESAGLGTSDWAYGSELPPGPRDYDRVVAITRSGTTTEVLEAMEALRGSTRLVAVTAVEGMPVEGLADDVVALTAADERSVVQTRFPTSVLLLGRAAFGESVGHLPAACGAALAADRPDPASFEHFVYLGRGWCQGLADEAALKIREAAQAWAESYPALDFRHGPIAVAGPRSHVWLLGPTPAGLADDVRAVGATVREPVHDPLVELVLAQRLAVDLAAARGLDPDAPRHLTRSVILDAPDAVRG
ncbi:SIS domain-containing protein [Phycicoccus sonneratiae]|uniref:SIS domain-containing protein n=1 Tax=Phycicoccus sonneratiae TaxID=2807628 RepID=A0ABS2CP63_9MICO|nr:SIS domain-containing protein [Phycicoccus sonneraticus]MBM6401682.1 SIS domain-containing protein [Phycicoccus sonneraticus]